MILVKKRGVVKKAKLVLRLKPILAHRTLYFQTIVNISQRLISCIYNVANIFDLNYM